MTTTGRIGLLAGVFTTGIALVILFISSSVRVADAEATLFQQIVAPFEDRVPQGWTASTSTFQNFNLVNEGYCSGYDDYLFATDLSTSTLFAVTTSTVPDGARIMAIDVVGCRSKHQFGSDATADVFHVLNGVTSTASSVTVSNFGNPVIATSTWNNIGVLKSATTSVLIGTTLTGGASGIDLYDFGLQYTYSRLQAPLGLTITNTSTSQNLLEWSDDTLAEENYVVQRSVGTSADSWSIISTLGENTTSTYDLGLTEDTVYCYRVAPKNWVATSSLMYSNIQCQATANYKPNGGLNLTAASTPGGYVKLEWTDYDTEEEGFIIERSRDGSSFLKIADVKFNITGYSDYEATSGNTYYYRIYSYNDIGIKGPSTAAITLP